MPSLRDCGGAVVLEAMASALPVIATAWGGPMDYLDSSCGILVPAPDPDTFVRSLADAMVRLATEPSLRDQLGHAGRRRVLAEFDWERKMDYMLKVYRAVQAGEPVPEFVSPVVPTRCCPRASASRLSAGSTPPPVPTSEASPCRP